MCGLFAVLYLSFSVSTKSWISIIIIIIVINEKYNCHIVGHLELQGKTNNKINKKKIFKTKIPNLQKLMIIFQTQNQNFNKKCNILSDYIIFIDLL